MHMGMHSAPKRSTLMALLAQCACPESALVADSHHCPNAIKSAFWSLPRDVLKCWQAQDHRHAHQKTSQMPMRGTSVFSSYWKCNL